MADCPNCEKMRAFFKRTKAPYDHHRVMGICSAGCLACAWYRDRDAVLALPAQEPDKRDAVDALEKVLDRLRWNLGGEDQYLKWAIGELRRKKIVEEVEKPLAQILAALKSSEPANPKKELCTVCGQSWKDCERDGCYEDNVESSEPAPPSDAKEG